MPRPTLPTVLLALACGILLGVLGSTFFGGDAIRSAPAASQPAAAPSLDPILERLERLETALRELRLAAPAAPPAAAGQLSPPPAETASARMPVAAPSTDGQLEERLASLEAAIVALRQAVAEHMPPAQFPSLELLQRAPAQQNAQALQDLRAMPTLAAAKERVQWRTQEEILQLFGRPSNISPSGRWWYETGGVTLEFVQDYVVNLELH